MLSLARLLRFIGVDARVYRAWSLGRVESILHKEGRTLLKLGNKALKGNLRAYRLQGVGKWSWLKQIAGEFGIEQFEYGSRCLHCNSQLGSTKPEKIVGRVPQDVLAKYSQFKVCFGCGRVYWHGGQFRSLRQKVVENLAAEILPKKGKKRELC